MKKIRIIISCQECFMSAQADSLEEANKLIDQHNNEPCQECPHLQTVTYSLTGEKPCIMCGIDTNTGKPLGWTE